MLSPDYLNLIEFNDVVKIYEQLNVDITADIIERVSARNNLTETTKNQLRILKQLNSEEIFNVTLERTAMLTADTKKALRDLFADVAKEDMQGYKKLYEYRDKPFKLSEIQYKILNQGLKQTNRILKNFTNTIAFQSKQAYVDTVDKAYMKVISGAFDYQSAIDTACRELANKGVTLQDKLGRNVQLEVAVRRNVLTGIRETVNHMNRDIEEYLGCNGYEVTAHIGARPTHAEAQGQQYALNKKDSQKYGIGLWKDVEHLWSEYNCRHTYFGIILGISEPVYAESDLKEYKNATVLLNGKEVPYYEATQKQRRIENSIRKQKRTIQTLEKAGKDTIIERTQLRELQKKYNEFCKETGLQKDYSRIKVTKVSTNNTKRDIMIQNKSKEEKELQFIGKLDKAKLGIYGEKIVTEDVILTNERLKHIKEHHPGDFEKYGKYATTVIENPDYVLEDSKNRDTILCMKTIEEQQKNVQIVVRLNTNELEKDKQNSIITFWKIKDSTYRQFIRNKNNLWKKFDKNE